MPGARFSKLPDGWFECRCGLAYPEGKACQKCGQTAADAPPSREAGRPGAGHPAGRGSPGKGRRTKAEAVYLASLESRKASGAVAGWIEQPTLPLPDGARYRPDFLVFFPRGPGLPPRVEVHEVKGGHVKKHLAWSEAGVARYRAARALLPWLKFRLFVVEGDSIREGQEAGR